MKALNDAPWIVQLAENNSDMPSNSQIAGRASVRCSLPDHLPVVGQLPDVDEQQQQYQHLYKALPIEKYPYPKDFAGLYTLTGLGSRGLTTAPLMAELLASQLCGKPLPLPEKLLNALNPNRFLIRDLIRRQ